MSLISKHIIIKEVLFEEKSSDKISKCQSTNNYNELKKRNDEMFQKAFIDFVRN